MVHKKFLPSENSRTFLTINPVNKNVTQKYPQFLAATLATISALCAGMCLSWTSAAIPMLQRKDSHVTITDSQGAWIGSLITLGACFGAIPAGAVASMIGRKRMLQILALPLLISWLLIYFGGCVSTFYIARTLAGFAIGAISVAAPMYVAELAEPAIRGTLGTFFQVQITVGLLIEYTLGGTILDFKLLALISSILPVVFFITFSFMPESPVFLCSKGKNDEAKGALLWFRGEDYDPEDELSEIKDNIREASVNKAKLSDLINCKATFKGLIISLGLMVFQQLSGINAVLFYADKIFSGTGSSMPASVCSILVGAVQVAATLLSTILIDKAGRKLLLFISAFVMCICLIILGAFFYLKQTRDLSDFSVIPLISVMIFIIVFSIGFGPIPWMIMGEIFTSKMKSVASSVSASFNWTLAFTVTNQFQTMIDSFGIGITFIIFGVICGFGSLFVATIVPETKGKDITQVQQILLGTKCKSCTKKCTDQTSVV